MLASEIVDKIKEITGEPIKRFANECYHDFDAGYYTEECVKILEKELQVKVVSSEGCYDGQDINVIVSFFKGKDKIFLRFKGSYSSWDSHYFEDSAEQVFPKRESVVNYYSKEELERT